MADVAFCATPGESQGNPVLEAELAEVCGQLNVAHARLVRIVRELLRENTWAVGGIHTPEQFLTWQAGVSPAQAGRIVRAARRVEELPETFAAFAAGELSFDQTSVVVNRAPVHHDHDVAEFAKYATVPQLQRALQKLYVPPQEPEPEPVDHRDQVSAGYDDNDRYTMHVSAPAIKGAIIDQALEEARDALRQQGRKKVTWLDALVEICERSLDSVTSRTRRDRYRVYIHVDVEGGWINNGPKLPAQLIDELIKESELLPLWSKQGSPFLLGRTRRLATNHQRRLVLDRDRRCTTPTCAATRHLEINHTLPWDNGGNTDLDNLDARCTTCHHKLHNGTFTVTGPADATTHTMPDGQPMRAGPRFTTNDPPPTPDRPYIHPTGEPLDLLWVTFPEAPV